MDEYPELIAGVVSFFASTLIIGGFRLLLLPPVFARFYAIDTAAWSSSAVVLWELIPVVILAVCLWIPIASSLRHF